MVGLWWWWGYGGRGRSGFIVVSEGENGIGWRNYSSTFREAYNLDYSVLRSENRGKAVAFGDPVGRQREIWKES